MKKLLNKNTIVAAVHAGEFHADDAACIALLQLAYGAENVTIRREFRIESTEGFDFILDVGQIDEVSDSLVRLDHHPVSGRQGDWLGFFLLKKRLPSGNLFTLNLYLLTYFYTHSTINQQNRLHQTQVRH